MNSIESIAPERRNRHIKPGLLVFAPAGCLFLALLYIFFIKTHRPIDLGIRTDLYQYFLPLTDLGFDMISRGFLPLWNPYINCGMPLASSIEIGLFYPPNWIHLLCPSSQAFNLLIIFHTALAVGGAFLYARNRAMSIPGALIPAMVFGFSGPMILHLWAGHMSILAAVAWIPMIFFCLDQCFKHKTVLRMLALTGSLSCQFLAGFPIFTMGIAMIIAPYVLVFGLEFGKGDRFRRNLKLFLLLMAGAVLSFALVCIQFFPTIEFMDNSHRGVLKYDLATSYAFPIQNLITFIIPDFYGNLIETMYWGPIYIWDSMAFCGVITLLLSVISLVGIGRDKAIAFWTVTGIFMIGIGLGRNSPLYDFAYHFVPGMNLFRGVGKFFFFAIFALGILAGKGLDLLMEGQPEKPPLFVRMVLYLALCAGICGASISVLGLTGKSAPFTFLPDLIKWVQDQHHTAFTLSAKQIGEFTPHAFKCMLDSILVSALSLTGAALAVILSNRVMSKRIQVIPVILLSILALELYLYDYRYMERSKTESPIPILTKGGRGVPDESSPSRIAALGARFEFLNRFIYDRLHETGGYENQVLNRYDAFVRQITGGRSSWSNITMQLPYHETAFDMLNVKHLLLPVTKKSSSMAGSTEIAYESISGKYGLFARPNALDRVFIVHTVQWAKSMDEAVKHMPVLLNRGAVDGTVIESGERVHLSPVEKEERNREKARIVSYRPTEIHMEAELVKPGFLVMSDNFYPGWEARVNGIKQPIYPANLFMRAVYLEKGHHSIVMTYRPGTFFFGAAISAAGLLICLVLLISAMVSPAVSSRR